MKQGASKYFVVIMALALGGCSEKAAYFFSSFSDPLPQQTMTFEDSGKALYYTFTVGAEDKIDTYLFLFPGSGCSSLKYYLRRYTKGVQGNIRIFALQKRFVSHNTTGVFGCPGNFDEYNYFSQWVSDYGHFVKYILATAQEKPKNVVFLGVSEGAWPAAAVADKNPDVTLLAIIGHGGMKMRDDLKLLVKKGDLKTDKTDADLDTVYQEIFQDPNDTSKRFLGQTYKYWSSVLDIDPIEYLLPLKIPVILAIGEKDKSVPLESAYYLKERFDQAGKQNLTLVVYPDADHTLKDSSGKSHRTDFLRLIGNWK